MKIVHVLFDDYPFLMDWGYQENKLVKYEIQDNDVTIITGKYVSTILAGYLNLKKLKSYEELNVCNHTLKIYRLNYLFGSTLLGAKVKWYIGFMNQLKKERPDVIFLHDLHALSLFTLNNYLKKNKVLCNADIHVNYVNSCGSRLSYVLHRYFYRYIIQKNYSSISTIFYLNENSKKFLHDLYDLKEDNCHLEFLPLGGEMCDITTKSALQKTFKEEHKLLPESIIFVHSGKMNTMKKTIEIMEVFSEVTDERFCLYLIGTPAEEIKEKFNYLIERDNRIHFVGWQENEKLMNYLIVCDVYLQPGSPSVTAHEAMCKGCATVLSSDGNFYKSFIGDDSAIYIDNRAQLKELLKRISCTPELLNKYKINGYNLAKQLFDYRFQSERILR